MGVSTNDAVEFSGKPVPKSAEADKDGTCTSLVHIP